MPKGIFSSLLVGIGLSILGCFALRPRLKKNYCEGIQPCSDSWLKEFEYHSGKIGHDLHKQASGE